MLQRPCPPGLRSHEDFGSKQCTSQDYICKCGSVLLGECRVRARKGGKGLLFFIFACVSFCHF